MLSRLSAALPAALLLVLSASTVRAEHSDSCLPDSHDCRRLHAVNADNGTVTLVYLKARKAVHEIKPGDKTAGVTRLGNGPLAAVTVYRDDRVAFINADTGK